MKAWVKKLLPSSTLQRLQSLKQRSNQRSFFKQRLNTIHVGNFEILIPSRHALAKIQQGQPYRDLCVGISAKYISSKYPQGTLMDIGANIGDTAAMMASFSPNRLVLIEASDYYFGILSQNAARLPNPIVLKQVLIADGKPELGSLQHWGGTAFFRKDATGNTEIQTVRLCEIADESTRFVKIDTDGFDFMIIADSLEWLAAAQPALLFEDQIQSQSELENANDVIARLMQAGYAYFIVWDDPGRHVVSTGSLDVLKDLNRYLFKTSQTNGPRGICNYDILCLQPGDIDIYQNVTKWYRAY